MHKVSASGSLRLLILTPSSGEGDSLAKLLRARNVETHCCADVAELRREYALGAGAAAIAADYFTSSAKELADLLCDQPDWSDFPLLALAAPGNDVDLDSLLRFGNIALVSQPADSPEFITLVHTCLRDRHRQYATRDLIIQRNEALAASHTAAATAHRAKSEFLAKMGHEIRSPMSAVLGFAEVLLTRENAPDKIRALQAIKRNGESLIEIINDILDLSKIEAGKLAIQRDWFDPRAIVADVESQLRERAEKGKLNLQVHYEGFIPSQIHSDAKRLRQILHNLVGNALKFTQQGKVTLIVRCLADRSTPLMEFAIIDTGIGISPEQLTQLFQDFTQPQNAERNFGGTGLGLAISKQLANLLGGDITCQSTLGIGSTFTVTVDAGDIAGWKASVPEAQFQAAEGPTETSVANSRILIVDDRRDVRFLAQHVLEQVGAKVILADDGQQALHVFEQSITASLSLDAIVLDMQMPHLDGYSTAQRLRSLGYTGPIIALTADTLAGDRERSIQAGCNAYLCKPIDRRELVQTVSRLLRETQRAVTL